MAEEAVARRQGVEEDQGEGAALHLLAEEEAVEVQLLQEVAEEAGVGEALIQEGVGEVELRPLA